MPFPHVNRNLVGSPQLAGVWTWSRGDGWAGPYIPNEFWVKLNAWVISHFGRQPGRREPELFEDYARIQLTHIFFVDSGL